MADHTTRPGDWGDDHDAGYGRAIGGHVVPINAAGRATRFNPADFRHPDWILDGEKAREIDIELWDDVLSACLIGASVLVVALACRRCRAKGRA